MTVVSANWGEQKCKKYKELIYKEHTLFFMQSPRTGKWIVTYPFNVQSHKKWEPLPKDQWYRKNIKINNKNVSFIYYEFEFDSIEELDNMNLELQKSFTLNDLNTDSLIPVLKKYIP